MTATTQQPAPSGTGKDITDIVKKHLDERREYGIAHYGEPLRAFNGRDLLIDAYQEALDLVLYLCQLIIERDFTKEEWENVDD